ncbi:MAG: AAA family ATPase, partial [Dehalococcoidia bacterium]|nr:AAA family ATPase [Dehalococcoidia bacterium]
MNVQEYIQRRRKGRGRWLIEPIIGVGHNLLIYGQKGEGKSLLAWEIARAVARGAKLFGKFQATLGKVIIVDEETSELDFEDRVTWTFVGSKRLAANVYMWPRPQQSGFCFDDDNWLARLKAEIDRFQPKLLIVDNLSATAGKLEFESSNTKVGRLRQICTYLRQNCKDLVIVIIHHEGKDKARGPRGSSALGDMSDTEIEVTRVWDEPFRFAVTQKPRKRPVGSRPFIVELRKKGNGWGLKYLGVEENIELPKEEDILMAEHFVVAVPRGEERSIE